jgi:hypothetical protein
MNREEIYCRVVSIAERFGPDNTQEFKLLSSQLIKCESTEVLAGLLLVFSRSDPLESNDQKQELAGRLLETINPSSPLDLDEALPPLLHAYELSIEQLPRYLADWFGKETVVQALRRFESKASDPRSNAAAKTMRWWLGCGETK